MESENWWRSGSTPWSWATKCARLPSSNLDASAGCSEEVQRLAAQIRQAWPQVKITIRGDSGFCCEELMAYVLMEALRRLGLKATAWAQAQCDTIRLKVLKIGALVRITVRRVWVSMAGGYPYAEVWARIWAQLQQVPLRA